MRGICVYVNVACFGKGVWRGRKAKSCPFLEHCSFVFLLFFWQREGRERTKKCGGGVGERKGGGEWIWRSLGVIA